MAVQQKNKVAKTSKTFVTSKKSTKSKVVSVKKKTSTKKSVKVVKKKVKAKKSKLTITEQVEKVLDTLRPYLISDGGNIELLGVDETNGIVTVHLVGACASCSSAQVTLYAGVEKTLKEKIPQINALIAV